MFVLNFVYFSNWNLDKFLKLEEFFMLDDMYL